ncbi:MAG: NADH-quinone oxidoreductase subunit F, partial [Synergistaceae bacterium]|nr:NADH-quinone oxidoreductase subunit F [Synergistaceae bacterium]
MAKMIVKVGMASCGIAAGAGPVYEKLESLLKDRGDVELKKVGCIGLCFHEPLVEIEREGKREVYGEVTADSVVSLLDGSSAIPPILSQTVEKAPENLMMGKQVRIVLRNCGLIDPQKIEEYEQRGGYASLKKALFEMSQDQVIDEVLKSGLRGRGGAGFPTGMKWRFAHDAKGDFKYVVC